LALAAGVDFYGVAAEAWMTGTWPAPDLAYRVGVFRHVGSFELRRSWRVLFGRPQAGYNGPWPSRVDALFSWIVLPWRGLVGALDDPLPAVGDLLRLILKGVLRT
jgi:hypothetical protein